MTILLFDGEGIEAEHLPLGGGLLGRAATNKKLNDIKKELQKKPKGNVLAVV